MLIGVAIHVGNVVSLAKSLVLVTLIETVVVAVALPEVADTLRLVLAHELRVGAAGHIVLRFN